MLLTRFIVFRWKETARSGMWRQNVAANVAIGFLVALMLFNLLVIGFLIEPMLLDLFPDRDPEEVFCSVILYYFMYDLFIRYLMQGLPTFAIESFLHLPIRRSSVVHFIMLRTWLHLLNFLPLLVFVPFALTSLAYSFSGLQVLAWIVSISLLIFANGFLATWLKRLVVTRAWITLTAALLLILAAILDRFGVIAITSFSEFLFLGLARHPWTVVFPVLLLALIYLIQYKFLRARMYPDEVIKRKSDIAGEIPRLRYLESMGLTGDLMLLEMKLWWRHKRTRSMLYLLPLFLLYGLFFYPKPEFNNLNAMLIFVGIFMSGGLMMNYLNYAFGCESNYFDGILTRRIDMERYIRAKLTIGITATTLCYILTIPYVFFGLDILLINTAAFLFNIGFLSYILLYLATYNKMRLDLSRSSAFNYQGMSARNWLVLFPAFLLPVLIYLPFRLFGLEYLGMAVVGAIGLLGIVMRKYLVHQITRNFIERKYTMAEGFRG